MEVEPFSYYFVFTMTLNLGNIIYILAYINQYSPIKIYQRLYGTTISILYMMGDNIVVILHIYGTIAIFLLFCDHQDTESESCEIYISIYQSISTHKKYQRLFGTSRSILYKMGRKYCGDSSYLWS